MTSDNADLVSKLDTLLAARLQPFGDRLFALETTDAAPRDTATPSRQPVVADPDQVASQSAPSPLVRRRPSWLFGAEASTTPPVAGNSLHSPSMSQPQQQQQQQEEEEEGRRQPQRRQPVRFLSSILRRSKQPAEPALSSTPATRLDSIRWMQKAAKAAEAAQAKAEGEKTEAEAKAKASEESQAKAEGEKVEAEVKVFEAEAAQAKAEGERAEAEAKAKAEEAKAGAAEAAQAKAEGERMEAEAKAIEAESKAKASEEAQAKAEGERVEAEVKVFAAEAAQAKAEGERTEAETKAKAAESLMVAAQAHARAVQRQLDHMNAVEMERTRASAAFQVQAPVSVPVGPAWQRTRRESPPPPPPPPPARLPPPPALPPPQAAPCTLYPPAALPPPRAAPLASSVPLLDLYVPHSASVLAGVADIRTPTTASEEAGNLLLSA